MRPIKLEIEGLHSFEAKQIIDFDALSVENIFGIFGQTGSGKSTVLDAIVLALYGKVQRSKTNSDFINIKSKKAEIKFNFLFTEGGEKKEYLVIRTFKRKAKKEQEVDQIAEVYEVGAFGSRQLVEGASKVDKFISNLLGMTDTEFLKCVALPQGEFAAFLKARPNERISIIGNIFDLNKYGDELWEKVRARCDALETDMAVLNGKLSVLGEVDEECLTKDKEVNDNLLKSIEMQSNELAVITKTEKEEREVVALLSELEDVTKKVESCEEVKDSIDFKKMALTRAKKLNENKFLIEREGHLTADLLNENDEIYRLNERINAEKARQEKFEAELEIELDELNNSIKELDLKLDNVRSVIPLQKELKENNKTSEELKHEKEIIENKIETTNKKLANKKLDKSILNTKIIEVNKEIEELRHSLNGYDLIVGYSSLNKFSEELKTYHKFAETKHSDAVLMLSSAITAIDKNKKEETEILEKIKEIQKEYKLKPNVKDAVLGGEKDKLLQDYQNFLVFKTKIENKEEEQIRLIKKLALLQESKKDKEQEKLELDAKYNDVYEDIILLKKDLGLTVQDKNKALSQNGVATVINSVKIGDSCPICRNEVLEKNNSYSIDFVVIDNAITSLEKNIEIKEEKKESLVYKTARVMSTIEDYERQIEETEQLIDAIKEEIQKEFISYTNMVAGDTASMIEEIEKDFESKIARLESAIKKEKLLFEKLQSIKESNIKNTVLNVVAKEQSLVYAELMNSISNSISEKDIEMLGIVSAGEDFGAKLEEMKNISTKLDGKLKEREELNSKMLTLTEEIMAIETELASLLEQKKANIIAIQKLVEEIKEKESLVSKVVVGDASELAETLEKDIANKNHRIKELAELKIERQKNINDLKNSLTELVVLNKTHAEEHKLISQKLQELLKSMGAMSLEEVKPFIISEEEIVSLENSVVQYETKYKHFVKRKEEIEEKLDGRISGSLIIEQLAMQVVDATKKLEETKAEQLKHSIDINRREEKVVQIKELAKELSALTVKYDAAKELYSAIKGKALLEYIAEEFIDDISFMASNKLQILMDGKYELKYENREFYVVDNFNGGAIRPVLTLSGGEMFVVSLALALSISDAIVSRSNKTIDFFFLDEGFGSLDKDYCEYVVDSLMKLTSTNLTIGLISHIPELQERISQKIYITKTEHGSVINNISSL